MLTSLVLQFTPIEPVNMPRDLGRASHALFLHLMTEYDAEMAKSLHESGDLKPFTCSNVFGGKRQAGSLLAAPGDRLWVRFTATNRDRYWLNLVNVLADFAVYAGVGRLTTQGMGQARRVLAAETTPR
jgi:CRISPR Cas6 N-terminal domain